MPGNFAPFEAKMRADGLSDAAVAAFKNAYDALTSGARAALHLYWGAFRFGPPTSLVEITGRAAHAARCAAAATRTRPMIAARCARRRRARDESTRRTRPAPQAPRA